MNRNRPQSSATASSASTKGTGVRLPTMVPRASSGPSIATVTRWPASFRLMIASSKPTICVTDSTTSRSASREDVSDHWSRRNASASRVGEAGFTGTSSVGGSLAS